MKTRLKSSIRRAFTLIELLTVIAIIGILAAIIIPTVGKVRESARGVRCTSNLRSVGVAMSLFTEDNKGRLPGPLSGGQGTPDPTSPGFVTYTAYKTESIPNLWAGGLLPVRLGPYMGYQATDQNRSTDVFLCPQAGTKYAEGPSWYVVMRIDKTKGSGTDNPSGGFSYYGGGIELPFGYCGNSTTPPKTMSDIYAQSLPPSRLWAIIDCSQSIPGGFVAGTTWASKTSPSPVHGKNNNALFFDWRIGKVDANGNIL